MPSWSNPHVPLESIREMKRNLPEDVYRQEVAAQFLLDSAGVFRNIKGCIRGVLQDPIRGRRYVMGVDLARLKDFTVLTVMDAEAKHVVYHERFQQIDWEVQYSRMVAASKRYNNAAVCMDSTGIGDPIVQTIQSAGVHVEPYKISGTTAKQQLIDKLRVNVENNRISFPVIPVLKRELEAYEYEISDNGRVSYSAPSGQHDDCVISLALANWYADSAPFVYRYRNQRGI
jgi:phage FluMu gp28-like protein